MQVLLITKDAHIKEVFASLEECIEKSFKVGESSYLRLFVRAFINAKKLPIDQRAGAWFATSLLMQYPMTIVKLSVCPYARQ